MERFVMRLSDEIVEVIATAVGVEATAEELFGENRFALLTMHSPFDFQMQIVNEDTIVEEVSNDSSIHVLL